MRMHAILTVLVLTGCAGKPISPGEPIVLEGQYEQISECIYGQMTKDGYEERTIDYKVFRTQKTATVILGTEPFLFPGGPELMKIGLRQVGDGQVAVQAEYYSEVTGKYRDEALRYIKTCGAEPAA